jgi:hypothetical protein
MYSWSIYYRQLRAFILRFNLMECVELVRNAKQKISHDHIAGPLALVPPPCPFQSLSMSIAIRKQFTLMTSMAPARTMASTGVPPFHDGIHSFF